MKFFLSETEQIILNLLWQEQRWIQGVEFWEYFNAHGKPSKRQTINTYLTRMVEKGFLVKSGKKYMYAYTKEEWNQKKGTEILNTMFDGSLKKCLIALTGNKKLSKKDVLDLKEYLSQFEEEEEHSS